MPYLKAVGGFLCFLVLASNVWSMSRWSESRGVYDDICYLRQAHLFQQFGVRGLDTDIARNDDRYLQTKLKAIGFAAWEDPAKAPCHTPMPAANKVVIQYPPGTGFVLALFPEGFQVIPLYVSATAIVFGFALLGIFLARSTSSILLTTGFGCLAIYLMVNPTKASYSVAPTMVVCALAGFLTARLLFSEQGRHRLAYAALIGLLLGLAVNFRLPNLFLASGYGLFLLVSFLLARKLEAFLQGAFFAAAFLVGHDADADRQRDQCRQPVRDHLRKHRCDAARTQPGRDLELCGGHAIRSAGARGAVDRPDVALAPRQRRQASGPSGRSEISWSTWPSSSAIPSSRPITRSRSPCSRCGPCCLPR